MAHIADAALDAALDHIANGAELLVLCNAQPTTFTEANATFRIASVALAPGDYSKANGSVSGRKLAQAAKTVTGSAAGTATHYAVLDVTGSVLLVENTMTNVAIENGGTQDVNAVDVWEIRDPA